MTDFDTQAGPIVERIEDGTYVIHDGERKLILPADTTPEALTKEIVMFYPALARDESLTARLARYLWPFGRT